MVLSSGRAKPVKPIGIRQTCCLHREKHAMHQSTPALSSFSYGSQPIPSSDLGPPAHFAKLEHVQSPCRPARIADNDGFPLVLRPGQDIGAIPLTWNHLHNLKPPEYCEEKQRQDQQNSRYDCRCLLSSKVPLNDAGPARGPSSD